jgi:hypothetical protein
MPSKKPKSTQPAIRAYYASMKQAKVSPYLLFRSMRIKAELFEDELVRCESQAEVRKKLKQFSREMRLLSEVNMERLDKFVETLGGNAYEMGQDTAQRAMKSRGVHFEGEEDV